MQVILLGLNNRHDPAGIASAPFLIDDHGVGLVGVPAVECGDILLRA
jgi:hypothetical protein